MKYTEKDLKDARVRCAMCGQRVTLKHKFINPDCKVNQ